MSDNTTIDQQLNEIGEALRQQPSVRPAVMRRVTEAALAPASPPARRSIFAGRTFARVAAIAACAVIAIAFWSTRGGGGLGAQEAFAAAIANVGKARTFSATGISKFIDKDGKEQVRETVIMFREPNLERIEIGAEPDGVGQVMIRDYDAKRELVLHKDKTADLSDIRSLYSVEMKTGELQPTELETGVRDDVLRITAQAVKEIGVETIDGRETRALRSDDAGEPVKTVWVDKETGKPVKIQLWWPTEQASYTYASIRIDEPLDDTLFSLDVPKGFALAKPEGGEGETARKPFKDYDAKMLAKMKYIVMACYEFSSKHDTFPAELTDLSKTMDERALRTLLAAPDQPEGDAVVKYRKPREGKDAGSEIVVYEAPEHRREGKVIAGMYDGHSEVLTTQRFEELMK